MYSKFLDEIMNSLISNGTSPEILWMILMFFEI